MSKLTHYYPAPARWSVRSQFDDQMQVDVVTLMHGSTEVGCTACEAPEDAMERGEAFQAIADALNALYPVQHHLREIIKHGTVPYSRFDRQHEALIDCAAAASRALSLILGDG